MITLTVAGALTIFALVSWILGTIFDFGEIAMIGGVILLGVGVMITGNGLEYQTGETEIETEANETEVVYEYSEVETPTQLPLGFLVMLIGASQSLRSLNQIAGD